MSNCYQHKLIIFELQDETKRNKHMDELPEFAINKLTGNRAGRNIQKTSIGKIASNYLLGGQYTLK